MLAGFLCELRKKLPAITISCCIPYCLDTVKARFPEVKWHPYTNESRESCIRSCDVWLGLGGAPFQNSVSNWFIDHLINEHKLTIKLCKPMAFLGIGSQDHDAFGNNELINIIQSSDFINTRDLITYNKLIEKGLDTSKLSLGADLGHLFFSQNVPKQATKGLISTILNTDYKQWPKLNSLIESLGSLNTTEQIWLIQELRNLPGSEQYLYNTLSPELKKKWKYTFANRVELNLSSVLGSWPTTEWTLTSRYHAALVSFWSGSKTTILALNSKLESVANEFGLAALPLDTPNEQILASLTSAKPVDKAILAQHTARAKESVDNFCATFSV